MIGSSCEAISKLLHKQLDNDRRNVRQAAVNALKAIGGSTSVTVLQARRNKEESTRMIEAIDSAIAEIQKKQSDSARGIQPTKLSSPARGGTIHDAMVCVAPSGLSWTIHNDSPD